ncbi:cysteinyl-tRNA synthetase [Aromatoleum aromaticum EbN1]|uniref:Cysteine--tRNA ligase n=1 Tax=Aromatoleum aromaticum (strain DSM 19018 / LMG 30748 / EbN1) TaxID=76114 RepID=SYC_AROAE|nr:cysteine--tRNA ligase [Aromatoleum aromaticum]Q5P1H8.1 RecName: Full=Cysteine--tRNA ligase; AltName: Full=Cysteinyl-tRNA synthetase; Short=CysRS [Aromatoleum aromaticum EbN1]CAI08836.1 cysteinyl-tRNA synthetase [Aromatoleum aromaticum EbN1]
MLHIHNTLTRRKEAFVPIAPGKVRMYVCGMTVYDYCHLGHARVMVVFDMVARWLRASGFELTYVRNITDIDDKIIRRAGEKGESIRTLTDRFIAAMHEDADALGVLRPDHEPRATEYVMQMQSLIGRLRDKGLAYVAGNRDVCYSVRKFDSYGRFSGKSLDELRAGERVEVAGDKQDPLDFVLWKHARTDEPDEVKWASPWGAGRPGWHIECSAMSSDLLGEQFDIHGGGQDLQFPHHENEIAQSEGAHGHTFVNYWMHNGFVRVDDEKMSKSLGNFFTIRDVLERFDPEVVRFFILRAHYRSPLNYSDAHLEDARQALTRLYTALRNVQPSDAQVDWDEPHAMRFRAAMDDDFNTAEAVAVLFELANEANRSGSAATAAQLKGLGGVLGLLAREPASFLQGRMAGEPDKGEGVAIESMIERRALAKKSKDYAEADRIRAQLLASGIVLEDTPHGTVWRRA